MPIESHLEIMNQIKHLMSILKYEKPCERCQTIEGYDGCFCCFYGKEIRDQFRPLSDEAFERYKASGLYEYHRRMQK
jgi:hypothetical protein